MRQPANPAQMANLQVRDPIRGLGLNQRREMQQGFFRASGIIITTP
jgi:hypothetical protein